MNDDILVVAVSPDAKYIAAALLDCTVKVILTSLKSQVFSCYSMLLSNIICWHTSFVTITFLYSSKFWIKICDHICGPFELQFSKHCI